MYPIDEIAQFIEELAPAALAEDWDNVGTLVNCGGSIGSVLVSLDITTEVVLEAEALGCQLIVAHHPVIFRPLKLLSYNDVAFQMVQKGISGICAHTNLDSAQGGVNDVLAAIFNLHNLLPFGSVGRMGELAQPTSATQLAQECVDKLGAHVSFVDCGRPVQRLAVVGGSGGSFVQQAAAQGADCLLTGEADHHDALDARHAGVSLVVAGHFCTEFPVVPVLAEHLQNKFPALKVQVSRKNKEPFQFLP